MSEAASDEEPVRVQYDGKLVWGTGWVALRRRVTKKHGFAFYFGPQALHMGLVDGKEEKQLVGIRINQEINAIVITPEAEDEKEASDTRMLRPTPIGDTQEWSHTCVVPRYVTNALEVDRDQYNEYDPLIFSLAEIPKENPDDPPAVALFPEGPASIVLDGAEIIPPEDRVADPSAREDGVPEESFHSAASAHDIDSERVQQASDQLTPSIVSEVDEGELENVYDPISTDEATIKFVPDGTWRRIGDDSYHDDDVVEAVALAHQRYTEQVIGREGLVDLRGFGQQSDAVVLQPGDNTET